MSNDNTQDVLKSGKKKVIITLLVLLAALAGAGYYLYDQATSDTFLPGTKVNGVDVSGLDREAAEQAIEKDLSGKTLKIIETGKTVGSFQSSDFTFDTAEEVGKALRPGWETAVRRIFDKKLRTITVKTTAVPKDAKAFENAVSQLSIVKDEKYTRKTRNAYIDLTSTDFKIVKEVYGDNLDVAKLKKAILTAVAAGKTELDYQASDYYEKPTVTAESAALQKQLTYCKEYLTRKITYKTPRGEYTITPDQLNKLIAVKDDGTVTVKQKNLTTFVKDILSLKASTVGITRTLTSVTGETYTVSGGNFGRTVDVEKESAQLTKDLQSKQDVSRSPIYTGGVTASNGSDIGNSFVEVNLRTQTLYCVKNGQTVLTSPIVSGKVTDGHGTPAGTYALAYKVRNATLEGKNADGSDYKSDVSYWMPFNGGIGFRDAPWRSAFGGGIYYANGSHGCINMPPANAGKLFYLIDAGTPVIVHW